MTDRLAILGGAPVRSRPFPSWPRGGDEEGYWLRKVLTSEKWFAGLQGDDPEALGTIFGRQFASFHGARFGLPVANGSVAIEIALRALDIGAGDEVIVPSYTFLSTATSVLMVGAVPVFADIDPESYCMAPAELSRLAGPNTKAVIPVHLGGHMADMPLILSETERLGLAVIEDCAQAIGASLEQKKAGTWGDIGTFSFQSNKTITCGEGGLVLVDQEELAEKVVALRAFGRYRDKDAERSSDLTCVQLSGNHRLSEFQAAVLLGQFERFPQQDKIRQANAERLTEELGRIPGVHHVLARNRRMKHGYYYYLVRYEPEEFGDLEPRILCRALNAEGIPFVPGDPKPLYRHPVFRVQTLVRYLCPDVIERYGKDRDRLEPLCPAAEEACRSTILLRHQVLLAEGKDMDDIAEALWKVRSNIDLLIRMEKGR